MVDAVERVSALHGHYPRGRVGTATGEPGVVLREVPNLSLHQIAAWPGTLTRVAPLVGIAAGTNVVPAPGMSTTSTEYGPTPVTLLRVEPLKWWLLNASPPQLEPEQGATLDLSHSRTHLRITGKQATALLNRHLPLDLREHSFPKGAVASSALHHVGVTLWRSEQGYDLFIPRGFALSVWEVLLQTAAQFGAEIA